MHILLIELVQKIGRETEINRKPFRDKESSVCLCVLEAREKYIDKERETEI